MSNVYNAKVFYSDEEEVVRSSSRPGRELAIFADRRPAIIVAALSLALTLILKSLVSWPYTWAACFFSLTIFFAALTACSRAAGFKYLYISLMSVMLSLFITEIYLRIYLDEKRYRAYFASVETLRQERDDPTLQAYQSNWNRNDPLLGYSPYPDQLKIASRRMFDNEILYDVSYTTLPSGWRITPQYENAEIAVVFFGCSITFGEGLNDQDSIPYKVGEKLGEKFQTFNFAFHGYGSHQMLAQIENGFLEGIYKKYKKVHVIYTTIDDHRVRSGGWTSRWTPDAAPWFELENGKIVRKGKFLDRKLFVFFYNLFKDSLTYIKLTQKPFAGSEWRRLTNLHAALIKQADEELKSRYNASLLVLSWPDLSFKNSLYEQGLTVLDLAPFFPDFENNRVKYQVHRLDNHPNTQATDIISGVVADYLAAADK